MQTSGFVDQPVPLGGRRHISALIFVSERGTVRRFNLGQAMAARPCGRGLDSLAVEHHTITRIDELSSSSTARSRRWRYLDSFPSSPPLTGCKSIFRVNRITHAHNAKAAMNRYELTELIAQLKHGGSGDRRHRQRQFRTVGVSPAAAEFLSTAGQHGADHPDCTWCRHRRVLQQSAMSSRWKESGSLLMQLGCLATVAMLAPKSSCHRGWTTVFTRSPVRSRQRAQRPLIRISRAAPASARARAADED